LLSRSLYGGNFLIAWKTEAGKKIYSGWWFCFSSLFHAQSLKFSHYHDYLTGFNWNLREVKEKNSLNKKYIFAVIVASDLFLHKNLALGNDFVVGKVDGISLVKIVKFLNKFEN